MPIDENGRWVPVGGGQNKAASSYYNRYAESPKKAEPVKARTPTKNFREIDQETQKEVPKPVYIKPGVNPEWAIKHPNATKALNALSNFISPVVENPYVERSSQTANEIMLLTDNPNKVSTGSKTGDMVADLIGGLGGFVANPGAVPNVGLHAFNAGVKGTERVASRLAPNMPGIGRTALGMGAGSVTYEGARAALNDRNFDAGEMGRAALVNAALGALTHGAAQGMPRFLDTSTPKVEGLNLSKPFAYEGPATPFRGTRSGAATPETIMPRQPLPRLTPAIKEASPPATKAAKASIAESRQNVRTEQPQSSAVLNIDVPTEVPVIHDGYATNFRQRVDRSPAKQPLRQQFTDMAKNLRTQFVDDLAPLERLEKGVTGKVASAEDSLYKQARLFRGSPEKANELVRSRLGPVIKSIEKKGYDYKDLGDYALAVHARDVNAKGINSGFTDNEIASVIHKYGTPEMEAARQELVKVSTDLLEDLAESGVIDSGLVTALREKYPNYMPLFRSFNDDKVEFASGLSRSLANVTSPIKKLEGSDRKVVDPLENMVRNVFQSTSAADRNRVARQLTKLAEQDAEGHFLRRLPEGEERSRLNTVYVRENGKKVHYEVQPDVYKAIMSLDRESSNFLIKLLQKPASVLRAGATLTPEFSFRNPIRDIVQAFVVSKSGFNPIIDFPSAMLDIIKSKYGKKTLYNQFLRDSGGFGNIVSMDRNIHQETVKRIIKQPTSKRVANVLNGKSLINLLRSIADATESATKLGEYKRALKKGVSRQEAAYRARDLMDFGRAGVSIREANKVVAFLNANIQGKSKLIRAIQENPVGVTTRALTSITLPTVGAYLAQKYLSNETQKRYIDDASPWLKQSFWLVPVPGTNQVARIPKPFDLAPIFANLPERLLSYIDKKDPQAFDNFARETFASYSIPTMLTGLMPFVEGMANYSFFRQGPIIPQREQDVNFPDQYDINTTETAKFIAKGVNKVTGGEGAFKNFGSPRIIDNTIRGVTGGLGTYATGAIDLIVEGTGIVEKKNKPAKKISEQPLLKAFLVNETGTGKAMNDLYEERERLTREKGTAEGNKTRFAQEAKLRRLNGAVDRISRINKLMRQAENDKKLSPQEKRKILDRLNNNRNDIAIQTMKNNK